MEIRIKVSQVEATVRDKEITKRRKICKSKGERKAPKVVNISNLRHLHTNTLFHCEIDLPGVATCDLSIRN